MEKIINGKRRKMSEVEAASFVEDQRASMSPRRVGTRYEVRKLFSDTELHWFYSAAKGNSTVEEWLRELDWVTEFWLDHPTFEPMLGLAVQGGGMTADRKAEILATDFNASQGRLVGLA